MTLRGYVKDGVVVPYEPSLLEEGAEVDIQPRAATPVKPTQAGSVRRSRKGAKTGAPKSTQPIKKKTKKKSAATKRATLRDVLEKYTGVFKGLPRDFAANHDHYIHGTPKRK